MVDQNLRCGCHTKERVSSISRRIYYRIEEQSKQHTVRANGGTDGGKLACRTKAWTKAESVGLLQVRGVAADVGIDGLP